MVLRKRALDDRAADAALGENARLGAAVDRPLQERNEHHLGNEEGEAKQGQPGLEIEHVADHAHQDAALEQRLGDADAGEAADRFGLLQDHGDLHARPARASGMAVSDATPLPRTPLRSRRTVSLGHPAAIDIEDQLEGLLGERHARIGGRQPEQGLERALADHVVDDAALQFERHRAQQEDRDRQQRQPDLVHAGEADDVAHDGGRHRPGARPQSQVPSACRMLATRAPSDRGFSSTWLTPERAARRRNSLVGTTGDQDRRHRDIAAAQGVDQLQAVHDGHAVVDDEAAAARQIEVGQQRLRPGIEADAEAFDLECELERTADGGVVVDDKDSPDAWFDTQGIF